MPLLVSRIVRFLVPLLPVVPFFFALLTLMGGGVPVRGISSSTSYTGNEGGRVLAEPFRGKAGVVIDGSRGTAERGTAPSGISPTRSTTKGWGEAVLGVLRKLGSIELPASMDVSSVRRYGDMASPGVFGRGGRSSKRTTGIESISS